ncbi:lipase-like PAD4 [Curcuma longa]|uniref:lipase-like PAD4 n=1 Tax=Curcuma longa TaxID=136217 RepID=UPI003D9E459F
MDSRTEVEGSMFETSHVLGALLASSPLLTQAWTSCLRANAGSASFVVDRSDDAVFVAFSGAQAAASPCAASSGLGGGFFEPVPLYSGAHELFAPLGRGEEDDGGKPQPVLLQAGALRSFMSLYRTSEFQLLISETQNKSVVLTGHSVGGCVASLLGLYFLCSSSVQPNAPTPASLLCITFGSPLIGNETLSRAILRERWGGMFCNVVAQHDIMPRLLFCPLNSMPNQFTTIIHNLMQSWCVSMRSPQCSRSKLHLPDDQKAELCQYISMHIREASAAEQKHHMGPYRPFGNYAFCSTEGAVCISDPVTVLKMLHLAFITGDASSSIEEQHVSYGDLISMISENRQFKKRLDFEEYETKSNYSMGVSLALEASGIGVQEMGAMEAREWLELSMCQRPKLNSASLAIKLAKVTPCRAQIEWYKALCDDDMGYYDCFKLRKTPKRDGKVNMNRIRLGVFWDKLLSMLQDNKLPHDFLKRDKWVNAAQFYKLLVEPLDIAEYYRCQLHKTRGHYLSHGRERRYEVFDKWWNEDKESSKKAADRKRSKFAGLTQDSCFWAKVEEARECLKNACGEKNPTKLVELWHYINGFESYVNGLIERKEVSIDVLAPRSSYSLWVNELKEMKLKQAHNLPSSSVLVGVTGGM